jgi:hypothetical protein
MPPISIWARSHLLGAKLDEVADADVNRRTNLSTKGADVNRRTQQ